MTLTPERGEPQMPPLGRAALACRQRHQTRAVEWKQPLIDVSSHPGGNVKRLIAIVSLAGLASVAVAQGFPSKPVRMIVPFPAGGSADITARLVAAKLAERLGQPVIVDNRVGASGIIGSELVAKAPPDGYTLLFTTTSTHLTAAFLNKNLPYHPSKDFTPISVVAESATGLVVAPSLPVHSVRELVEFAKRNPGKLTYSSAGIGSSFHLTGELFRQAAGIDIVHVPYKGAAQALNDLMSGTISMTFSALASQMPFVKSGKVRLLAVLESERFSALPDVPSVRESLPNFERPDAWMGLFGPAGLPAAVLQRLNADLVFAVRTQEIRAKFMESGFTPLGNTPEEFAALIRRGFDTYGKAVKAAGLKAE